MDTQEVIVKKESDFQYLAFFLGLWHEWSQLHEARQIHRSVYEY